MSERAIVMPRERPARKKRVAVPKPADVWYQVEISPAVRKKFRMAAAWYELTKAELFEALSTQIDDAGRFTFPWGDKR